MDFLVKFDSRRAPGIAARYFGLHADLATTLGREVDLLTGLPGNKYLVAGINHCRELLYEA